ncbi:hypothetical protein LPJ56_002349 [Coemansia sp. RSA 2599]|nr:hypothetical protein LPJ75_001972 [Coemansia sp. RSA 2598]KAJ1826108.1 hypothetical protein LPJ56_002349 [Coemansia sp. RSA 2599]
MSTDEHLTELQCQLAELQAKLEWQEQEQADKPTKEDKYGPELETAEADRLYHTFCKPTVTLAGTRADIRAPAGCTMEILEICSTLADLAKKQGIAYLDTLVDTSGCW